MKWSKKGHEFDQTWEAIRAGKRLYLFGAGEYGALVWSTLQRLGVEIQGFLDNDRQKQGGCYCGLSVCAPEAVGPGENSIVLCVSPNVQSQAAKQMENAGFVMDRDLFSMEKYLSVYYAYGLQKVYFPSISFLPSTRCNLNCEACLNFTPYMETFDERPWEQIQEDVDLFFRVVDEIMLFHISGGEPMLYPHMKKLVEYIGEHYREKIHVLKTVTNGTVLPSVELLQTLKKYDVALTVDDYREAVPSCAETFQKLLRRLEELGTAYEINKADEWIDLAPQTTRREDWSEAQLYRQFERCHVPWQELRGGKLYSCNYSSYAIVAGLSAEHPADSFDLRRWGPEQAKELMEFRMGYNERGFVEFCRHCSGYVDINPNKVTPAKQKKRA